MYVSVDICVCIYACVHTYMYNMKINLKCIQFFIMDILDLFTHVSEKSSHNFNIHDNLHLLIFAQCDSFFIMHLAMLQLCGMVIKTLVEMLASYLRVPEPTSGCAPHAIFMLMQIVADGGDCSGA